MTGDCHTRPNPSPVSESRVSRLRGPQLLLPVFGSSQHRGFGVFVFLFIYLFFITLFILAISPPRGQFYSLHPLVM